LTTTNRGMSPPGVLATRLAGRLVVLAGRAARPSRTNVRHPATAQVPTARPFVLDGLPGTTVRRPRSVAGRGRAFGACCFAGKLRSPAGLGRRATVVQAEPYAELYAEPYAGPYAGHPRTPSPAGTAVAAACAPRGEWSGQAEWMRFARLIHRPVRVLGGPAVRAAFRGIRAVLVATQRGAARPRPQLHRAMGAPSVGARRGFHVRCRAMASPAVPAGACGGRSHSDTWVGCVVCSTTASSSPVRVPRSSSSRSRPLNVAIVWAAL